MKIKAGVTLLFRDDGASLYVEDRDAGVRFLSIDLTPEATLQMLSRLSNTYCDAEVRGLDHVGKVMEVSKHEFKMPKATWGERKEVAVKEAVATCPKGWTSLGYFGSQDSFFQRDGEEWARVTIRRWVDKEDV